jgi:hypothetical protein
MPHARGVGMPKIGKNTATSLNFAFTVRIIGGDR